MPALRVVLDVGDKEALFSLAYQLGCYERKPSSQLFQVPAISELLRQMAQGKITLVKGGKFAVAQRGKPRKEAYGKPTYAPVSGDGTDTDSAIPAGESQPGAAAAVDPRLSGAVRGTVQGDRRLPRDDHPAAGGGTGEGESGEGR